MDGSAPDPTAAEPPTPGGLPGVASSRATSHAGARVSAASGLGAPGEVGAGRCPGGEHSVAGTRCADHFASASQKVARAARNEEDGHGA